MQVDPNEKPAGRQLIAVIAAVILLVVAIWRITTYLSAPATVVKIPALAPAPVPPTTTTKRANVATSAPATTTAPVVFAVPSLVDDPAAEGWDTEVFSKNAELQLKHITKWLVDPSKITLAKVAQVAAKDVQCGQLRPDKLQRVFEQQTIMVDRAPNIETGKPAHHGLSGLIDAITQLHQPFKDADDLWTKVKLFNVSLNGDIATTRQYITIAGTTADGPIEENVTWLTTWTNQTPPLLKSIAIEAYERATLTSKRPLFSDCTEAVLKRRMADDDLLGYNLAHWNMRIAAMYGQTAMGYHGLALGDVNGDGLDDVYVCHPGGMPNQLFVHNPDGTVNERAAVAGLDWMDVTFSALFVDLDNDGDQDLVAGTFPRLILFENGGKGRFRGRKFLAGSALPRSIVAADADNDGDLDLYICYYTNGTPLPYHDANNGPKNIYWRNDGDFRFVDMTSNVGLNTNNTRFSYGACFDDYDNDGDQDLYVANDFGRNNLYRNKGDGTFEDVAPQSGTEDISPGMSAAFGDYNNDGYMDLYVANMFSSAGNRIMLQDKFKPNVDDWTRSAYQRHARGNSLFKGSADGTFEDVSIEAGVTMGRWAWCSLFVDINNDMYQDLVVANGHITNENTKDL